MSIQVICPECGKEILPADADVDSSARCRCGEKPAVAPMPVRKKCYRCGKDVSQHKRWKDRLGRYWCAECALGQRRANRRAKQFRCHDCNREFPPAKLMRFEDSRLCESCKTARIKAADKRLKAVGIKGAHRRKELEPIIVMALILGFALLVATLQWIF